MTIADLKPYAVMKDSGVPWLGPIPKHWGVSPGRACYSEHHSPNTGLRVTTVLSLSYGRIVIKPQDKLHGLVPASFETYQVIEPGDIVIRPTDLQNDWDSLRFGLSPHRGIITSAYLCFRPGAVMTSEYGHLLLHTYDLKKVFYGLGSGLRQNLDWSDFKYLPCVVPPQDEQTAIVRFLDHADRRIRRYIRAKQKLIKLLEEQKQAIIHRAVTRGLDPNVRLKPSGVEWLGDVPEHWNVVSFVRLANERADYRGATPAKTDSGVFLVTARNIRKGRIDYEVSREFVAESDYVAIMRRGLPKRGDLLLTMEAPLGHAALVDREDIVLAQRVVRFRFDRTRVEPRFVLRAVLSPYFQNQLLSRGTGSTAMGIKASKLPQLQLLVPPMPEQLALLDWIQHECQPTDVAVERAQAEISLLREYRTRLIADVVTGKLDVREEASRLPDELEEPEPLDEIAAEGDTDEADADDTVSEAAEA